MNMWNPRENEQQQREGREKIVAVAIDKDKFSQHALKWAADNILSRHQTIKLVHVIQKSHSNNQYSVGISEELIEQQQHDIHAMEVFLPFRCYCTRRHIQCELVVLERQDVARALIEYVSQYGVETMLLGAPTKNGLSRSSFCRLFKASDTPGTVLKWAPDFCNVYIVSKGKCHALRSATRPVPPVPTEPLTPRTRLLAEAAANAIRNYDEFSTAEMEMTLSNSGRLSTESNFFSFYESLGLNMEGKSFDSPRASRGSINLTSLPELPSISNDSSGTSSSSQNMEDVEDDVKRLKMELKQTMDMYNAACKEALAAKQKAVELEKWKMKEEKRLKETQMGEERGKAKIKAAIEAAEAAQKIAKLEVQKRVNAEAKALKEAEEKRKLLDALWQSHMSSTRRIRELRALIIKEEKGKKRETTMARRNGDKQEEAVAVAIDKDKGSQYALRWAVDHLLSRGQNLTLLHVKQRVSSVPNPSGNSVAISKVNNEVARIYKQQVDNQAKELFVPFRCFCTRKEIKCKEIVLEDTDIAKALIDYVSSHTIETLVLGAASRTGFVKRFKTADIPSNVSKGAPDYCNVYVIGKGKISSVRSATASVPVRASPGSQLQSQSRQPSHSSDSYESAMTNSQSSRAERTPPTTSSLINDDVPIKSPFLRGKGSIPKYEPSLPESDISFVSSGRPSTDRMIYDMDFGMTPWLPTGSDYESSSFVSLQSGSRSIDGNSSPDEFSSYSQESGRTSSSSQSQSVEEVEVEMRRLRLELRQTMDMYSAACKEALSAKQKARELHRWKLEEKQKLEEARMAEEAALALAEKERAKCKRAIEAAEAAQRIAELEAQKCKNVEFKALREAKERKAALNSLTVDLRYRKYSIEEIEEATENFSNSRKIGEGGYGPVYKSYLDHTPVAIKVLRPDAAQGRSQFQQEVEVLCNIRHPNMVLLLGACPEFGCLIYEYMANGSLEDRLFRRGGSPVLPWQIRFRIAAEIATALLFLHQTKPEPLVHRDLKPGNILLDRNYVSKISDVGLARLVPPSVADSVTQYRMTSAAGTFCYIDPEYQQTGMLGVKSDVYSLGILLLQIITAKPPMGLAHQVERSIENGTFDETLDPAVPDWPVEEALILAKLALQCAELRRKDRPDLGKVVVPKLNILRALAEETMPAINLASGAGSSPSYSQVSTVQELISDSQSLQSGDSSRSRSSSTSIPGRRYKVQMKDFFFKN
ncbi:protein kinase domain-containing protein [Citrus sinensis]|uniref:Protein kinase domain-containing protein n=1 Tax=Citrus sinensis TaxID=2711 RepID=A0ACB8P7J7_CITSI|nr:protein kinase domain-containing protein [Citrus sinensis]